MEENDALDLDRLFAEYRLIVLETGAPPPTVYAFCKTVGIEEERFFEKFSSLDSLEKEIWAERVDHVVRTLDADEDYRDYAPRQKVLAFLFTFLESIKGQRSWFLARYPRCLTDRDPAVLRKFKGRYTEWADEVAKEAVSDQSALKRLRPEKALTKALYLHFRSVLKYYLEDESDGFEKTDAYIEKTVRLVFDLTDTSVPDSALDLFRFLSGGKK